MSTYKISDTTLIGIADAIRRKTGSSDLMYVSDMASNIDAIPGSDLGYQRGLIENTLTILSHPSVSYIPKYRFSGNTTLVSASLPGLETVDTSAFISCVNLRSFYAPSLSFVSDEAFRNTDITHFYAPNLKKIGNSAFANAIFKPDSDYGAYNPFENVEEIEMDAFLSCQTESEIVCPKLTVCNGAFQRCQTITKATLSIATMLSATFSTCSYLTEVNLPEVTTIKSFAFSMASRLTSVSAPKLEAVFSYPFYGTTSLSDLDLPELKTAGKLGFASASGLERLSAPKLSSIEEYAFQACIKLQSIYGPNISGELPTQAFIGCSQLQSFYAGGILTEIGGACFSGCNNLSDLNITLDSTDAIIHSSAFLNCHKLPNIDFASDVASIQTSAFAFCSTITSASLNKITYLAQGIFNGCINLSEVTLLNGTSNVNGSAFYNCANLKTVNLLGSSVMSLTSVFSRVFNGTPFMDATVTDAFIYVPSSLYNDYIVATRWSNYSSRISIYTEPGE